MTTIPKTAKALGLSPTTIRIWTEKFAAYLSPGANPNKGKRRKFTEDDLVIFNTISVLRDRGDNFDEINQALKDGTRIEQTDKPTEGDSPPASKGTALQTEAFTQTIASFEARLNRYETKIDDLQGKLLEATERATAAETELKVRKEVTDQKSAEGDSRGFWARLFNRG